MMRLALIYLLVTVFAACPNSSAQTEWSMTDASRESRLDPIDYEAAKLRQDIRSLRGDRILAYLFSDEQPSSPDIQIVFDPVRVGFVGAPATAFLFHRLDSGNWQGRRVVGVLPRLQTDISGEYHPSPGRVCQRDTFGVTDDEAALLDALAGADWKNAPQFLNRDCSHCLQVEVTLQNAGIKYRRHLLGLMPFELRGHRRLSDRQIEELKAEYLKFEAHVIRLSGAFPPSDDVECRSSPQVIDLPLDASREDSFETQVARIETRLEELRNFKE